MSRHPLARLLGLAPAALLLSGLFTVWAGPLAGTVAADSGDWTQFHNGPTHEGYNTAGNTLSASISDGTYIVGTDIQPGTYRTRVGSTGCYWERLSGFGGTFDEIIANDFTNVSAVVTISASDKGFSSSNCGTWTTDLSAITSPGSPFSDGTYIVGTDIQPGTYRNGVGSAGCYWQRLSGFGGTFDEIIANDFTNVSAVVTISASDKGFSSSNCGTWTNPESATHLSVSGLPSPTVARVAGSVTVTAKDASGNTATGYSGTVHISSSDGAAVLPADAALSAGVGTFSVTLRTAGTQSVTATDTLTASIKGSQSGIVVKPAAVKTLVISGLTTPRTAGTAGSIRVTAVDADGHRVSSYAGTVHFTSSDAKAKLPANYTFTAADAGTHVFSVTLKTAGTQSVTATDMLTKTIKGSQSGIVVKPAAVKTLVVSGLTTPRTAGTTGNIRVTAVDAYGNRVSGYRGTVHFTSSDAKAKLPANYKFTAADAGIHTFVASVILKTAGTQSVTATDMLTKTIKGAQAGIVVKPAAVKTLVVSGLTTPRTKGVAGTIRVTAVDAYGNRVSGYTGTIHFTSSDAKAKLPANYKFKATDAGTHVFVGTVILKTAGTQWLRARDTVTSTITGVQIGVVVH